MTQLKADHTIVIVTHNLGQAARVSDYTGFMYLGQLIEFGPTDELFTRPATRKHLRLHHRPVRLAHQRTRRPTRNARGGAGVSLLGLGSAGRGEGCRLASAAGLEIGPEGRVSAVEQVVDPAEQLEPVAQVPGRVGARHGQ